MNYSDWVTAVSTITAIDPTNTEFLTVLPNAAAYADNRIYRELDMMATDVRESSSSTIALNRNFAIPTTVGVFQIVSGVNVITPASTAPDSGTRRFLTPVSRDVLDAIYPSTTGAGVPEMFSYFSQATGQTNILFGPWPDTTYRVEVIGKVIPEVFSATNTETFLSLYLPDLYLAASMVFMTGYMQNWGAQADDPKMSLSWEAQYQALKGSADIWEARKRMAGASWTPKQPEASAVPQRG